MHDVTPQWRQHPECEADEASCQNACRDGDRSSCFQLADLVGGIEARREEAKALYQRACELGLSLGCVNYAAGLWHRAKGAPEPIECARRIFASACDVGDSMGCGMVGRMMIEAGDAQSRVKAREYFEAKCTAMKGPPCRMLAYYLERGDLGAYEPGRLRELMTRACEGDDVGACGEWTRVQDTFH